MKNIAPAGSPPHFVDLPNCTTCCFHCIHRDLVDDIYDDDSYLNDHRCLGMPCNYSEEEQLHCKFCAWHAGRYEGYHSFFYTKDNDSDQCPNYVGGMEVD
jgi:hypothetical protein